MYASANANSVNVRNSLRGGLEGRGTHLSGVEVGVEVGG
jgi:hypothetical protein